MTKFGIDIILDTKVFMKIGDDEVIVDPEFFLHAVQYNWHVKEDPRGRKYVCRWFKGVRLYMHREVLKFHGSKPYTKNHSIVDHIDNNSLNNHVNNLRYATTRQNRRNR